MSSSSSSSEPHSKRKKRKMHKKDKHVRIEQLKSMLCPGLVVMNNRFQLCALLGSGAFGVIYSARDLLLEDDRKPVVAIKFEIPKHESKKPSPLETEFLIYKKLEGHPGIPKVFAFEKKSEYYCLAMQLMGPNLSFLLHHPRNELGAQDSAGSSSASARKKVVRPLSLRTVLIIALQVLNTLELLHSIGYVHRDIKPENVLVGGEKGKNVHRVYLMDMGLAKSFYRGFDGSEEDDDSSDSDDPSSSMSAREKLHIKFRYYSGLTGTSRYASVNAHHFAEQSPRDDLESFMFMLIELSKGRLPWQGIQVTPDSKAAQKKMILFREKKLNMPVEEITSLMEPEFTDALKYIRTLRFHSEPDYRYLRSLFLRCAKRFNFNVQWETNGMNRSASPYDWIDHSGPGGSRNNGGGLPPLGEIDKCAPLQVKRAFAEPLISRPRGNGADAKANDRKSSSSDSSETDAQNDESSRDRFSAHVPIPNQMSSDIISDERKSLNRNDAAKEWRKAQRMITSGAAELLNRTQGPSLSAMKHWSTNFASTVNNQQHGGKYNVRKVRSFGTMNSSTQAR